jgi:hypothetical protein
VLIINTDLHFSTVLQIFNNKKNNCFSTSYQKTNLSGTIVADGKRLLERINSL